MCSHHYFVLSNYPRICFLPKEEKKQAEWSALICLYQVAQGSTRCLHAGHSYWSVRSLLGASNGLLLYDRQATNKVLRAYPHVAAYSVAVQLRHELLDLHRENPELP